MIFYNEVDEEGKNVVVKITKEKAIINQNMAAKLKNYVYSDDEHALEDFKAIHWAWEE